MREALNKELPIRQAYWTIAAYLVVMYALLSANWLLALAVALVAVLGLVADVWWTRRRYPARTERVKESAFLPWSSRIVWDLIEPAEKAPLIDSRFIRGYHVPGTPDGVGEQQAMELLDGSIVVIEVIDYEPGRRAVSRQVSPPGNEYLRTVQSVEPMNGGCIYTMAGEIDLRAGQRRPPAFDAAWRSLLREQVAGIEKVLATAQGQLNPGGHGATDQHPVWPPPAQRTQET